jgi:hypothetical protein
MHRLHCCKFLAFQQPTVADGRQELSSNFNLAPLASIHRLALYGKPILVDDGRIG